MSKALKTAGAIIGGIALVATGIGAVALAVGGGVALGTGLAVAGSATIAGISMSTLTAIGTGLAFLGDATAKPLRVGGSAGSQVDFAADPNAPIPYAVGRTGTGGRIIYATTGEAKNRNILYNAVLSGGAPLHAITGFKANGEEVTFGPLQQAIGGTYANRMWQNRQLGDMPAGTFGPPNTLDPAVLGEWTAAHKLSGYAASWYVLGYDQKTYANGVPEAVWTIEGACVYDPRLDGTYPGGSGPHRIDDPATWTFSECPPLHGLAWALGRYANGVRVLGIGARKELIDIPAFVEAANIADANGWKVGGVVYSNDSKWDVLKAMCQAGGGRPVQLGASITMLVNAPRVSLATLTPDDLAGGYSVQAAQSVRGRPNQVIPKYRSEAHNWEMVAAGPVKVAAYVTADRGRLRSREVAYPLVQDAKQVAQLAAYDLVNAREFGPVTVACKPAWMGYKRGDCITVAVPDLAMNGQKALILARTVDPMTGDVSLTLQSETDSKHDFALGRTANPPPVPGLTGVDPLPQAPANGSWVAVGTALAGEDGSQVPAIVVTGQSDDPNATNIIVEYRLAGAGEWAPEEFPATRKRLEIKGLVSEATYQVRVRYRTIRGLENEEVFLDLGAVVTGRLIAPQALVAGGVELIAGMTPSEIYDELKAASDTGRASTKAILDLAMAAIDERGQLISETFHKGVRVKRILIDDDQEWEEGDKTFWSRMNGIAVLGPDGESMVISHDTLMWSPSESLAHHVNAVETRIGTDIAAATTSIKAWVNSSSAGVLWINNLELHYGNNFVGSITETSEIVAGMGGTVTNVININGHISGTYHVNTGLTSGYVVVADEIGFANAAGSTLYPFSVVGGITRATNFEADRVKANSITVGSIVANSIVYYHIQNGNVLNGHLGSYEVTNGASFGGGYVALSVGSWVTLASGNYSTQGQKLVMWSQPQMQATGTDTYPTFRLLVDGVEVDNWSTFIRGGTVDSNCRRSPYKPGYGYHSFVLEGTLEPGSGPANSIFSLLDVEDFRTER